MYNVLHLKEGLRMFKRRIRISQHGIPKYPGSPKQICSTIVKNCFKGEYFQVSTGHFSEFYMRDFGICVEALLKLGYNREVEKTLQYCLNIYSKNNKITTTITPDNNPLDVFAYAPDSLAFLLYSIRASNNNYLAEVYRPFLESQLTLYYEQVLTENGLVNPRKHFSSMKDNAHTESSCYNNCMSFMIQREAKNLKFDFDFKKTNFKKIIMDNFWQNNFFREELHGSHVSGDANTFPFWCGVLESKTKFKLCLHEVQRVGLDRPFPLQYARQEFKRQQLRFLNIFAPDYEGSTNWVHLGLCFMDIVKKYDKKLLKQYLNEYTGNIQKYQNFLELFNDDGTPYKTLFYHADDSMLWASKYLDLLN